MATTVTYSDTLVADSCWCGVWFAVPSVLHRAFVEDGKTLYCPLGHAVVVKVSDVAALRKDLERAKARETAVRDQLVASTRSNAALRGEATKARKRAAAGVCPCCHRSFVQMARHIASKHPGFVSQAAGDATK